MRDHANHLLITGGIYHPFEASAAALAESLQSLGLRTRIVADVEAGIHALARSSEWRLLTIHALRFTMTQHEKYAPLREQWAFTLSLSARAALERHVRDGGSLLGLHTASICFDGWEEWPRILGAGWVWGRSSHPPAGPVQVEPVASDSSIVGDAGAFEVFDEVYRGLDVQPDACPLLRARSHEDDEFHPVMWTHRYGSGRAVYDALGHGPDSLLQPTHLSILHRAVEWLIGAPLSQGGPMHA